MTREEYKVWVQTNTKIMEDLSEKMKKSFSEEIINMSKEMRKVFREELKLDRVERKKNAP